MEIKKKFGLTNQLIAALVIIVIVIAGFVINLKYRKAATAPTDSAVANIGANSQAISYTGEEGKNAYDLLKSKYTVVAEETAYGPLVKSINGQTATDSTFWSFKINGELAQVGAQQYVTKSTDTITWELTSIQ